MARFTNTGSFSRTYSISVMLDVDVLVLLTLLVPDTDTHGSGLNQNSSSRKNIIPGMPQFITNHHFYIRFQKACRIVS